MWSRRRILESERQVSIYISIPNTQNLHEIGTLRGIAGRSAEPDGPQPESHLPPQNSHKIVISLQVTDAGLEALMAALPQLTALNLKYIYRITDAGIATVARLTALEKLNVTKCKKLTDAAMTDIATFGQLRALKVSECELIGDAGALSCKSWSSPPLAPAVHSRSPSVPRQLLQHTKYSICAAVGASSFCDSLITGVLSCPHCCAPRSCRPYGSDATHAPDAATVPPGPHTVRRPHRRRLDRAAGAPALPSAAAPVLRAGERPLGIVMTVLHEHCEVARFLYQCAAARQPNRIRRNERGAWAFRLRCASKTVIANGVCQGTMTSFVQIVMDATFVSNGRSISAGRPVHQPGAHGYKRAETPKLFL